MRRIKSLIRTFSYLIPVIIVTALLLIFVVKVSYVPSNSMSPNAGSSSLVVSLKTDKNITEGEVIIFKKDGAELIKRVIGTPGDQIELKEGSVYINGKELAEGYTVGETNAEVKTRYTVPDDCFFVLGDNRENSIDSRYWEEPYVHKDNIICVSKLALTLRGKHKGLRILYDYRL